MNFPIGNTKGMFGNWFFPLFSVSKNNFLFLGLKNLFGNLDKKQKLFSKLNLWKKLKTCKKLFSAPIFQKSMKTRIWVNEFVSFNELALEFKS